MSKTNAQTNRTVKKGKNGKKAGGKSIGSRIGRVLLTILLVGVITGCIVVVMMTVFVVKFVKPYDINLSDAKLKFTSFVYGNDAGGNVVELAEVSGDQNRVWVDLNQVPKNLTNAIISTEDKRFNEHEGVDFRRTFSAVANYFLHYSKGDFGGSTLTQQLVKYMANNINDRRVNVKIREIVTAVDVEKRYSKDQILESYVNTITLGKGVYGVQAAANMYFNKDIKDLDLAQCAVLAGMIKSPNVTYNPYEHPDKVKERSKTVLKNMLSQKMITKAQYTAAVNEALTYTQPKSKVRSWFVDQTINDVANDLVAQKKCDNQSDALNYVYTKGLRIYTTENTGIQSAMDTVYQNMKYFEGGKSKGQMQYFNSGMMIVDYSGRVLGMEGSTGQKTQNMVLNRATATYRQPGSSFKPIATYAPALEAGLINWSSMFMDGPIVPNWNKNGAGPHDDEAWLMRNITIDQAVAESRNAVAVGVEQQLKPINSFNFLTKKLDFDTAPQNPNGLSASVEGSQLGIALGMVNKGVTVREMAGAYEIFGDGGKYTKPYTYTKVEDSDGNIVLQNKPSANQVISPETATIMNKLLQNVVYGHYPNTTGGAAALSNCPVAGKTGTTSDQKDRWWVGITPEYVGAVWTGYDQPQTMSGINHAITVWHDVFQQIEKSRDQSKQFPVVGNVVQENYDPATGNLTPAGGASGWYSADDPSIAAVQAAQQAADSSSSSSAPSSSDPSSKTPPATDKSASSSAGNSSGSDSASSSSSSDSTGKGSSTTPK